MTIAALPPSPKTRIPGANLIAFRRDPLAFLTRAAREHGDMVYWRGGPVEFVFVNHPDLVKEVLVTRQQKFIKSRGLQRAKRFLGEGLLTLEGDAHRRQRRLAQPAFHRDRVRPTAPRWSSTPSGRASGGATARRSTSRTR